MWGPGVHESSFASCLARHNTYVQEATGHRDINYASTVHDLKLLLMKFAAEESFSLDSGGGGPQSNVHLLPYLMHMALYVINTTRSATRETKKCTAYIEMAASKWIESSFEAEGVLYWSSMYILLNSTTSWKRDRIHFLKRFLVQAHARYCCTQRAAPSSSASGGNGNSIAILDRTPKEYQIYRTSLVFFGLVDHVYSILFEVCDCTFYCSDYIDTNLIVLRYCRELTSATTWPPNGH